MSDPEIFDRKARHLRAKLRCEETHIFHERIAEELLDRLSFMERTFTHALVLGRGTAGLASALRANGVSVVTAGPWPGQVICDEDRLAFADKSFDLVISANGLDTVNDLPGALILIRRILMPDGLFLAAFPGAGSLSRLRTAAMAADIATTGSVSQHVHPQIDARAGANLLARAGFSQPVTDCETMDVRYADLAGLVRDLRAISATNTLRGRRGVSQAWHTCVSKAFAMEADPDGRISESLILVFLTGWGPSDQSFEQPD
jgi:SAM-dependent methyltransferase